MSLPAGQIATLLHYYFSPERYAQHSDVMVSELGKNNLLRRREDKSVYGSEYEPTERGIAYIEALMAMPLPISKWIIP